MMIDKTSKNPRYIFEEENCKIMTKIADLCDWEKISRNELARRAGISNGTLSNLLTGKSYASLHTLYQLLNALDVTLEELFGFSQLSLNVKEWRILIMFRKYSDAKKDLLIAIAKEIEKFKEN